MNVEGKKVVITGGAGGLAAAIAADLAAAGAGLALLDLESDRLTRLADRLRATAVPVDVGDESSVQDAFSRASVAMEGIDGVVVTAGVQLHGEDGPVADLPLAVWERTMRVNLTGAFLCVKHAVPHLTAQRASSVVLIGSPTGLTMSGAGYTAYSASKAGMMSLARTVAADYAAAGLRANVVVPGTMQTPLTAKLLSNDSTRAALLTGTPVGRLGSPEDLTGLVRWLLSDSASFATGAFFAVDGGLTAR